MASASQGVVTRQDLLTAGFTGDKIRRRVRSGGLIPVHRGVYRVGHRAPSIEAVYVAAVRACGQGALLSGRPAGHLFGLLRGPAPPPEVTAPTERRVRGVTVRRSRITGEATIWRGVPVTTVSRTLVDLAAVLEQSDLARACHEAGVLHRTTPGQVEAVLARRPTSPGSRTLRQVLRGDARVTLSPPDARFLGLLREAGLPLPVTNRPVGTKRVDCRWPDHRLTVELDSYRFHNSRHSWEQDRRRELEARARADELLRYTYGDVFERPALVLADLRARLRGASRTSGAPPARR